jgi:hypothetical protein
MGHMKPDVVHDHLAHQSVDRPAYRSDLPHDLTAILFPDEGPFDTLDLALDPMYAIKQLGMVVRQMCHQFFLPFLRQNIRNGM